MSDPILIERKDGLLILTLQMNEKNVINDSFVTSMNTILKESKDDLSLRAIAIKGGNGFFSNGFDPKALIKKTSTEIFNVIGKSFFICQKLLFENPLPVFACINGHAMGYGAILPLFCDYRLGVDKFGRLGFPEILIGLAVPLAPSYMLTQLCGINTAKELVMKGQALKSNQALEIKYLDALFENEEIMMQFVEKETIKIKAFPRDVVRVNRQNLYYSHLQFLTNSIELDANKASEMVLSANGQEGLLSILEGRRPKFS